MSLQNEHEHERDMTHNSILVLKVEQQSERNVSSIYPAPVHNRAVP